MLITVNFILDIYVTAYTIVGTYCPIRLHTYFMLANVLQLVGQLESFVFKNICKINQNIHILIAVQLSGMIALKKLRSFDFVPIDIMYVVLCTYVYIPHSVLQLFVRSS